jgi:hypothetical protein
VSGVSGPARLRQENRYTRFYGRYILQLSILGVFLNKLHIFYSFVQIVTINWKSSEYDTEQRNHNCELQTLALLFDSVAGSNTVVEWTIEAAYLCWTLL